MKPVDAVVIGGGFFGCKVALALRELGFSCVLLVERESQIMRRASCCNQARIHNGYHYPRSFATAERSCASSQRFCDEYHYAIDTSFEMLYAIGRGSKITPTQFQRFCDSIGAPCQPAWARSSRLFAPDMIDAVFSVREFAFNSVKIAEALAIELRRALVDVRLSTEARIHSSDDTSVRVQVGDTEIDAGYVFNCTYAALDGVGITIKTRIKRELAELVLIRPPTELRGYGITVVDGPFFSVMPFPAAPGSYSLSHVRYTPHEYWYEGGREQAVDAHSHANQMIRDAARFVPAIARGQVLESMFEIKAVLARNEGDDARPVLVETSEDCRRIISVLGAKIDNIYDALEIIKEGRWLLQPAKTAIPAQ